MLQRVQTYYLGVIIIIQFLLSSGLQFFTLKTEKVSYVFNSWGITKIIEEDGSQKTSTFPIFIGFIVLALLAFLTIMSFKNIDRQFKLGRTVFYLYFVSVLSMYLSSTFADSLLGVQEGTREMGLGYWLFIAGFPFSFLANTGIKRDKKLLDSLKRL